MPADSGPGTVRGKAFVAAGLATVVAGSLVGEHDFVRLGMVAVAVPVLSWLLLRTTARRIRVVRRVDARRVVVGEEVEVDLVVTTTGGRTRPVLLEDRWPATLGRSPRWVVDPVRRDIERTLRYRVRPERRGRFEIGPVRVQVADPLGMVDVRATVPTTTTLLVTPRTEALPLVALRGRRAGAGDHGGHDLLGEGTPDATIRGYRVGDELRRIHWPSTARTGELMVRREEQPQVSRCTLLLDDRACAHRGKGVASSFETAVSVAASIARRLSEQDLEVGLQTVGGRRQDDPLRTTELGGHLEHLALVETSRATGVEGPWASGDHRGGVLVAVLGAVGAGDLEVLGHLPARGVAAHALVLDVGAWDRFSRPGPVVTRQLRELGWAAVTVTPGAPLAPLWSELGR